MSFFYQRRLLRAGLVAGLLTLLAVACTRREQVTVRESLVSASHVPLVLTEAESVAFPPSLEPNRFMRGWWPYTRRGRKALAALENARLQGVNLAGARRRLVLEAELPGAQRLVDVSIEGGPWQRLLMDQRLHISLPRDLPLGRFSVDIKGADGRPVGVTKAAFSKAAQRGAVEFIGEDIVQSGFSLVEAVHRVDGPSTLTGSFRPPDAALTRQSFSLRVRTGDDGQEREVFSWSTGSESPGLDFSVRLTDEAGWLGFRIVARGAGPAARWEDLTLETTAPVRRDRVRVVPEPPKVVVLYIMDALRRDHLGHLGGPAGISPTIDRLADQGASFERYYSIAPNTVPSMKSLLTGSVFFETGRFRLKAESTTLAEQFRDAGYRTALFSGNGNVSSWRGMTQGYEHVAGGILFGSRRGAAGYNNNAERIHEAALRWIEGLDPDEPAFMHLQTIHPHNPFDPPEPFLSRFASAGESTIDGTTETLMAVTRGRRDVNEADKERIRGLYAGGVAYNDYHLDLFLDSLLERYEPEEVLFILTSDHGEELFEHDSLLHGYTLYEEQLQIPLVVWWPGTVAPRRVAEMAVNLDLHATLSRLITGGMSQTGGGTSLWPLLTEGGSVGGRSGAEIVFAAASSIPGGIYAARSERLKVIYAPQQGDGWGMGRGRGRSRDPEYLFDLVSDPRENENLAGQRSLEADWLMSRLLAWIEAGKQLEDGAPLEEMDEETRESLRALGYLQ